MTVFISSYFWCYVEWSWVQWNISNSAT